LAACRRDHALLDHAQVGIGAGTREGHMPRVRAEPE
jgi:hypothetical protein